MGMWIGWLIVAAVLGAAEIMTTTLAFGLVAISAFAAAGVGFAGGNGALQFGAFAVASARRARDRKAVRAPAASSSRRCCGPAPRRWSGGWRRAGRSQPATAGGSASAARSGRRGPTTRPLTIPEGSSVDVLQIEGATALVHPRE